MRAVWLAAYLVSLGLPIYEGSVVMLIYFTLRQQWLSNRLLQALQENNWTLASPTMWTKSGRVIKIKPAVWIVREHYTGSMFVLKHGLFQYQKIHGTWEWDKRIECCIEDMYAALLNQACS